MRCFYCKKISFEDLEFDNNELKHIFCVLRLKEGELILLNDCKGTLAIAKIASNKSIKLVEIRKIPEPKVKVSLFVSPPRKQYLEDIITQCCETGAWDINLITTKRSVSIPKEKGANIGRWQAKVIEACKQSQNPYSPQIFLPITFKEAIDKVKKENLVSFFGTTAGKTQIQKYSNSNRIAWFVGPEGGFSEEEQAIMIKNSFCPLNLSSWVMRVETAAITGIVFLQQIFNRSYNLIGM